MFGRKHSQRRRSGGGGSAGNRRQSAAHNSSKPASAGLSSPPRSKRFSTRRPHNPRPSTTYNTSRGGAKRQRDSVAPKTNSPHRSSVRPGRGLHRQSSFGGLLADGLKFRQTVLRGESVDKDNFRNHNDGPSMTSASSSLSASAKLLPPRRPPRLHKLGGGGAMVGVTLRPMQDKHNNELQNLVEDVGSDDENEAIGTIDGAPARLTVVGAPPRIPRTQLGRLGAAAKSIRRLRQSSRYSGFYQVSRSRLEWLAHRLFWVQDGTARPARGFIIHPRSPFSVVWSTTIFIAIALICVFLPLEIAFTLTEPSGMHLSTDSGMDTVVSVLLLIDILVSFVTAYTTRQRFLQLNRWKIARHYAKSWFIIDFISVVPVLVFQASSGAGSGASSSSGGGSIDTATPEQLLTFLKVLKCLRLAKTLELYRVLSSSRRGMGWLTRITITRIKPGTKRLIVLGFISVIIVHFYACVWHLVGEYGQLAKMQSDANYLAEGNWIDAKAGVIGNSLQSHYTWSAYWAVATLTTVGYGDIVAENEAEAAACIVGLATGVLFYATVLGAVAEHMGEKDPVEMAAHARAESLSQFIAVSKLPFEVSKGLWEHHVANMKALRRQVVDESASELLDSFPPTFRAASTAHVYRWVMIEVPWFHRQIEPSTYRGTSLDARMTDVHEHNGTTTTTAATSTEGRGGGGTASFGSHPTVLRQTTKKRMSIGSGAELSLSSQRAQQVNLKHFASPLVQAIARGLRRLQFLSLLPGQEICSPGDPFTHVYFVSRGEIEIFPEVDETESEDEEEWLERVVEAAEAEEEEEEEGTDGAEGAKGDGRGTPANSSDIAVQEGRRPEPLPPTSGGYGHEKGREREEEEEKEAPQESVVARRGDILGLARTLMITPEMGHVVEANFTLVARGNDDVVLFTMPVEQAVEMFDSIPHEQQQDLLALDQVRILLPDDVMRFYNMSSSSSSSSSSNSSSSNSSSSGRTGSNSFGTDVQHARSHQRTNVDFSLGAGGGDTATGADPGGTRGKTETRSSPAESRADDADSDAATITTPTEEEWVGMASDRPVANRVSPDKIATGLAGLSPRQRSRRSSAMAAMWKSPSVATERVSTGLTPNLGHRKRTQSLDMDVQIPDLTRTNSMGSTSSGSGSVSKSKRRWKRIQEAARKEWKAKNKK